MTESLSGLGRRYEWDKRNLDYKLPRRAVARDLRRRMWWAGQVLDQGATPQCVGYAGWGWLAAGPITNPPKFTPTELYHWAQERDEWPGKDYEGSSSLGLMRALKDKGYISEYRWALDVQTMIAWVLTTGPVVVGTNWYLDMFTPDRRGYIRPTGENVGGHEWGIVGADKDRVDMQGDKGAFRMVNTWGRGWAEKGRAWVSFKSMEFLLGEEGDCTTATEIKL